MKDEFTYFAYKSDDMIKPSYGVFLICCLLLLSCGGKEKKNRSSTDPVEMSDFLEAYPDLELPFTYGDSSFPSRDHDSLLIPTQVFNQFIPDSITQSIFGANAQPKSYPVGKFHNGKEEFYQLTRLVTPTRKVLLLTAFDQASKLIASLPLIKIDKNTQVRVAVAIDKRFNINKDITQTLSNDIEVSGHDVFMLNKAAGKFMLIMTDSLGDGFSVLINPLDSLPRTHKYAADYGEGKMNLISIHDSPKPGRLSFFIHLEKNNKECIGELKGEITMTGENTAEYRQGGDACVLRFIFSAHSVKLEEVEGCGSRLGALQCSFNGNYPRKKLKKTIDKNVQKKATH